jgi:tetratricopeptide (TPR) repeat protein
LLQGVSLDYWFRIWVCAFVLALSARFSAAQNTGVTLDSNEALFTVLTAVNACGYDFEIENSDPLRAQIRDEVSSELSGSELAGNAAQAMCQFYDLHKADPLHNLSQYVSLALVLNPPPALTLRVKDADLPPDAAAITGILPLMQKFYQAAELHSIWTKHVTAYADFTQRYHEPLASVLLQTEVYLKLPSAGYLGRNFTVYIDPMGAPGQTNARNYGTDYYVVVAPGAGSSLKMEQIRHTYLHYLLDPLALKYPAMVKEIDPLLDSVKNSPMDESFKTDSSLLVTECLIRAIEARTGMAKATEADKEQAVQSSMEQGFVLTRYFYDALAKFEKDPAGLRTLYGPMLASIDVGKEKKRTSTIHFAAQADPDVLHITRPSEGKLLMAAEQKLSAGDSDSAQKLAQQALDEKKEDPGRALFILAQVATMHRDIDGARNYFQKALEVAQEPTVVAWSHIYLGRIFDLQEDREAALDQYRAAVTAGAELPEARAAAEHGLQRPYEPARHPK